MTLPHAPAHGRAGLIPALVLGAAVVAAALVFGGFFYGARSNPDTIRVVGSATQPFEADVVKWRMVLSRAAGEAELSAGYAALRQDGERLRARLRGAGIPDTAIHFQPVSAQPMWGREGIRTGYQLQQPLFVVSGNLDSVEALALDPGVLAADGILLESSMLEYFYSGIAELKRDLLGAATEDARRRAEEIGGSAGVEVGAIRSARAGVFQITEPYSTEVAAYGIHNTTTRDKEITVTVHAEFGVK